MSGNLKAKLGRWFDTAPEKTTPAHAAAEIIAFENVIKTEDWGADKALHSDVCLRLGIVKTNIYLSECTRNNTTDFRLTKKIGRLSRRFANTNQGTIEHAAAFNKLASTRKTAFLKRAQRLSKQITNSSYNKVYGAVHGVFCSAQKPQLSTQISNNTLHQMVEITNNLRDVEHHLFHQTKGYNYSDGPKTVREIIACTRAYINSHNIHKIDLTFEDLLEVHTSVIVDQSLLDMLPHLEALRSDLPFETINSQIIRDQESTEKVLRSHVIEYDKLGRLLYYFLEHNNEKLAPQNYAVLSNCLLLLQSASLEVQLAAYGQKFEEFAYSSPDVFEQIKKGMLENTYPNIPKPTSGEVYEGAVKAVKAHYPEGNKRAKENLRILENTRSQKPANIEEVVILHYRESEEVRKLRKKFFGKEKKAFLKNLATNHVAELKQIGLRTLQISNMREKGNIPEGSGLTVEHIIDREHGGTNHQHNFILMDGQINRRKDKYKKMQTDFIPDSEKGCWINTWVPKKNSDGTYPKIYIDKPAFAPILEQDEPPAFIAEL